MRYFDWSNLSDRKVVHRRKIIKKKKKIKSLTNRQIYYNNFSFYEMYNKQPTDRTHIQQISKHIYLYI